MKNRFLILSILMILFVSNTYAQCGGPPVKSSKPTSLGIVIYSNESETVWNALRLANYSISTGDTVNIFLLGKGVDLESLDSKKFNVKEQTEIFTNNNGKILVCGTCLQSRNISTPKACTVSMMSDLYDMIRKSKILLSF
jgi:sulfur relay (sulfurtransferase) complex TusBCD TusD component (DsrE family)